MRNYCHSLLYLAQIDEKELLPEVLNEFKNRESFKDTDNDLKERIFPANVFGEIVYEKEKELSRPALKQLKELEQETLNFHYVHLTVI